MSTRTIIYPGTFDPITNGHVDIIKRALGIFDRVIVAIAKDTQKTSLFPQQQRVVLAQTTLKKHANVTVEPFAGFLVEFAEQKGVTAILRGLRAMSDFEYEFQLAGVNRQLNPTIETIFLTPAAEYNYISSSMVRWMAELGGNIEKLVPPTVAQALKEIYR